MDMIEDLSNQDEGIIPFQKILEGAKNLDIKSWEINNFIEQLKKEGQIFEPKRGFVSVMK